MMNTNGDSTQTTSEEEIEVMVESDSDSEATTDTAEAVEETTQKNETSKPTSQDEKRSAGKVIAELGNEKKAIASQLVSLAKSSEASRQEVRKMLINDPSTGSYLKGKFGTDYDLIMGEKALEKIDQIDIEKIKEQARAQAQAEAIRAQIQQSHEGMVIEKAQQLGFTSDELDAFKAKVELLGSDEKAIEDAALIVNYKKATAKKGEFATSEGEADRPKKRQVTITPGLSDLADSQALDKKQFASDLHRIKSMHRLDEYGKPVMDLPRL